MGMFDDLPIVNPPQQPQEAAPQESPVDSYGRAVGNAVTMETAPYIGGAVNYAAEGMAPGSFDRGYQRSVGASENSQTQNPDAYTGGTLTGMALDSVIPGRLLAHGLAKGGALTAAVLKYGLRSMGWGGRITDAVIDHAPQIIEAAKNSRAATATEEIAPNLSKAMNGSKWQGNMRDPLRGPAPNARMNELSPEMQAKSDAYQAFLARHGR